MANPNAVPPPNAPRFSATNQPPRRNSYNQALDFQDVIKEVVMRIKNSDDAMLLALIAQLVRAWDVMEERKRILKFVPKPKEIDLSPEGLAKMAKRIRLARSVIEVGGALVAGEDPTKPPALPVKTAQPETGDHNG